MLFSKISKGCLIAALGIFIAPSFAAEQSPYREITCQQILANPEILWSDRIDLGSGYVAPTNVDYACQAENSVKPILSELINLAQPPSIDKCSGSIRYALARFYDFELLQIDLAPKLYLQRNNAKERIMLRNKSYYDAWAVLSPSNYLKYKRVQNKLAKAKPLLIAYYLKNSDLTEPEISKLIDDIATFFQFQAIGETDETNDKLMMSKLAYLVLVKEDKPAFAQVKALLAKASQQDIDQALKTALLTNKSEQLINLLIDHLDEVDQGAESALFFALNNKQYAIKLIKKGADVNYQNPLGYTPLFYAIANNNHVTVELLLTLGVSVAQNYQVLNNSACSIAEGETPLMHAAQYSDVAMLKLLVHAGTSIDAKDGNGNNALDYVTNPKYLEGLELQNSLQKIAYLQSLGLTTKDIKTN